MAADTVLVACDEFAGFAAALAARFPRLRFVYAESGPAIAAALGEHDPEVAFSVKHSGFPGECHRPIVEHPSVRWVQVGGSGVEHLQPWDPRRVTVTNAAGVLAPYLAGTVTGALLALNGNFLAYLGDRPERRWRPRRFRALAGQTLAVVGLGAIGARVAENMRGLGLRVIAVRREAVPDPRVDEVIALADLERALARADMVSLHVPLTDATRGLFGDAAFAAMRPGALFANTSRGAVVDERALVAALASGRLGGAYLDVFAEEPLPPASPLWDLPDVLLTPHAADNVEGWPALFAEVFADNLERWLAGRPLERIVNQS